MQILDQAKFEEIISWSPEGKSFFIHKKNRLAEVFGSRRSKQTKYDSFRRKLHRWGFKVVKKNARDFSTYYHEVRI